MQTDIHPLRVEVDPNIMDTGDQTLRFVLYGTDEVHISEVDIYIEQLPESGWDIDIKPIAEQRCMFCHAGSTATNLESAQQWENRFDDILDVVENQVMPPSPPHLTENEILLLRGWKEHGFLP